MKLLYCPECLDMKKLRMLALRRCTCGKAWGYYLADDLTAEYGGTAIPIAGRFVSHLLQNKGDHDAFADEQLLLTSGRLKSIDVIELVSFLEQTHGLDFTVVAFDPDDFDSIEGMAQLVSGSA